MVGQVYNSYRYACRAGVHCVQEQVSACREILCGLHGDPDEVVVIDPSAVTLSRRESERLRSSGEIPKFDFYSTSKVK